MNFSSGVAIGLARWIVPAVLCWGNAAAATLGGKLELEDEGSFFVNGQSREP